MSTLDIYAVILAAGAGSRFRGSNVPKQFMELHGSTIVASTVEKFIVQPAIKGVVVVFSKAWLEHGQQIFQKMPYVDKLLFCEGGSTRQESLYNACRFLLKETGKDCFIVSHDAARPFVSNRIIMDNIQSINSGYVACDTVVPCTDTIVESIDRDIISEIPNRNLLYQGQTPQSFLSSLYLSAFEKFGNLDSVTDAAKILKLFGVPIKLVQGDVSNIKITTEYDLQFANFILGSFR